MLLTALKDAIIRQYQKLFELDGVELVFEKDAVERIADKTIERKIGARGLRSIIEGAMLDVMYEIPSRKDITGCVMTKEAVDGTQKPKLICTETGKIEENPHRHSRKKKSLEETA